MDEEYLTQPLLLYILSLRIFNSFVSVFPNGFSSGFSTVLQILEFCACIMIIRVQNKYILTYSLWQQI